MVVLGIPYHITQRGNRREDVFFCDGDRNLYLKLLLLYCRKTGLAVKGYCLILAVWTAKSPLFGPNRGCFPTLKKKSGGRE